MVNSKSVVRVKPGNSGVVIRYQVDEFVHPWLAEHFIASSHICPGFLGKVSTLTHFPLKPSHKDYSFFDQAVEDFVYGLDSILTDYIDTQELDASLDDADAIFSLFSPSSIGYCCFCYF